MLPRNTHWLTLCLISLWIVCTVSGRPAYAQDDPDPTDSPSASQTPSPTPTLMSAADMMTNLESTMNVLADVDARWKQDTSVKEVGDQLTAFRLRIDKARASLTSALGQGQLSMRELIQLETRWKGFASAAAAWKGQLDAQATELDGDMKQLRQLITSWGDALKAESPVPLPKDLQDNITKVVSLLRGALEKTERIRSELLSTLGRIGREERQLNSGLDSIRSARKVLLDEFLLNESAPSWAMDSRELSAAKVGHDLSTSLEQQWVELMDYVLEHRNGFLLQGLAFGLLYLIFAGSRSLVSSWVEKDPQLSQPSRVLQSPVSLSLLLAVWLGHWLHPDPPPGLQACQGSVALIPGLVVLRQVCPAEFRRGLYFLAGLFVVDLFRLLVAGHLVLTRLIFTLEISFAWLCMVWSLLRFRKQLNVPAWHQALRGLGILLFGLSWLAVNLGFVRLAGWLGDATLRSLYVGALLVCLIQVGDGLILFWLHAKPMSLLPSVRNFNSLYVAHLRRWIRVLAAAYWCYGLFDRVGVLPALLPAGASLFQAGIHVGALHLTVGGLLTIVLSIWLPYQISRLARFVLEHDVYPQLHWSRGETYTLSTIVHYSLLSVGVLAGVLALGVDLTQFTVIAGALGVGMGFGLQSVVDDLVSGIVLLVERPVQVGHFIEVSGQKGVLEKIGLRSCVLRTTEGSEMVVPNGNIISNNLINWTLSDQRRLLQICIGVRYGSSPEQVQELLLKVAGDHPAVAAEPPPEVEFLELGDEAMQFQLQAWTEQFTTWARTRSELVSKIYAALSEAHIQFAQPNPPPVQEDLDNQDALAGVDKPKRPS